MGSTEEDIKLKVVYPLLRRLGFEDDELEFEESFPLRLGRFTYKVDTKKQVETAQPRLDILAKRHGKNLFIVEVKTDEQNLSNADRDQAVSYARLVHPMAPVAIVTNGRDTKAYEIIGKDEIQSTKSTILEQTIQADMIDQYEEAFKFFIGYSLENVLTFCQTQVREGMKTLLGSKKESFKKFIPDLHVTSKHLIRNFVAFRESDKPVFAIVGESGSGKTCALCGLALELTEKKLPILFYRAPDLTEGLMKSIANDFNWSFSTQYDDPALFKRLFRLLEKLPIDLTIIIDGLDEWDHPHKVALLGNFASNIRGKGLRLVVSCRTSSWESLLSSNGIPTSFAEEVFLSINGDKGCYLDPFDDEEMHSLLEKYRTFYAWDGHLEVVVLEECKRLPFLLRLFFEVGSTCGYRYITFSIEEFYEKYRDTVLQRIAYSEREKAKVIISTLAKLIFKKNLDQIDRNDLNEELKLPLSEDILPALFETNILERTITPFSCHIGFYFKKFRDYVIAFIVNRWNAMSDFEFQQSWKDLSIEGVQLDAMRFFYQFADIEKKKIIDEPLRKNATEYLCLYIEIINTHFSNLRHRFPPYTFDDIGFVADIDIERQFLRAYGFRSIVDTEERVKFIPFERGFWNLEATDRDSFRHFNRASGMHFYGAADGFRNIDIKKEVLTHEVQNHLEDIIDHGQLDESNNYYLSLEKILGIVVRRQSSVHGNIDKRRFHKYLPLTIDKIEYGQRYRQAEYYFARERTKEKIVKGIIKPKWSKTGYSYHEKRTDEDFEYIRTNANEAASRGEYLKANEYNIRIEADAIKESLPIIRKIKGVIDETILPDQDEISSSGQLIDCFTDKTLTKFITRIYAIFLDEYKTIVETNFPTIRHHFSLYSRMPVRFFIVVGKGNRNYVEIYKCSAFDHSINIVTECQDQEIILTNLNDRTFNYGGEIYSAFEISHGLISSILNPRSKFTDLDIDWTFTVLRYMVYSKIKAEFPAAMKEFLYEYGVAAHGF